MAERQHAEHRFGGFLLCEGPDQYMRAALGLLTTRTVGDYDAMPLERRWWPLYRVTRPFRLALQTVSRRTPAKRELGVRRELTK